MGKLHTFKNSEDLQKLNIPKDDADRIERDLRNGGGPLLA